MTHLELQKIVPQPINRTSDIESCTQTYPEATFVASIDVSTCLFTVQYMFEKSTSTIDF